MTTLNSCPIIGLFPTQRNPPQKMAENKTSTVTDRTSTFINSVSTQNPPPKSSQKQEQEQEEEEGEAGSGPESKRRKTCPTILDKIQEFSPSTSNANFSFTFDTKFAPRSPESTPKFGSFNFAVSDLDSAKANEAAQEQKVSAVVGEFEKD